MIKINQNPLISRTLKIPDSQVESTWAKLSAAHKRKLKYAGCPHKWGEFDSYSNSHAESGRQMKRLSSHYREIRAKLILRIYLEQDKKCAYTGIPLSICELSLDHIHNNSEESADNFAVCFRWINQKKSSKSLSEFTRDCQYIEESQLFKSHSVKKALSLVRYPYDSQCERFLKLYPQKRYKLIHHLVGGSSTIGKWSIGRSTRRVPMADIKIEGRKMVDHLLPLLHKNNLLSDQISGISDRVNLALTEKFGAISKRQKNKEIDECIRVSLTEELYRLKQ